MLEALWSVEFVSNMQGFGAGVAVFETGRIFGGDSQYYYVGAYRQKDGVLSAELEVTHYAGEPSSVFGPAKKFHLKVSGKPAQPTMEVRGHVVENPNLQIYIRLTRRADLP